MPPAGQEPSGEPLPSRRIVFACRNSQLALTSPHTYYAHGVGFVPVDDPERRMNELPQAGATELRHYAAHTGMIRQALDPRDYFAHDTCADIRYALFRVPSVHRLEIGQCRFGKPDFGRHFLVEAEPRLGFIKGKNPA